MASGGARARSGPAPDPNALRRERDAGEWTVLPAAGRKGRAPAWPLVDQSDREVDLWRKLWVKPQALMWERFGQEVEVAMYVRRLAEAEQHGTSVGRSTLVRQMADSLGLTTPGLRANRWRIPGDEVAQKRAARAEEAAGATADDARVSARDRLKSVSGGGA